MFKILFLDPYNDMLLCDVQAHYREEETAVDWWVDGGTDSVGLIGVWENYDGGFFYQAPGTNIVILRQQLSGSGTEPSKGVE